MFWMNFLCLCIIITVTFTIDADYYFSSPLLRSQVEGAVCNRLHMLYCQVKCGTELSSCIRNRCYCVSISIKDFTPGASIEQFDVMDTAITTVNFDESSSSELTLNDRPTLRHHIAHFCPNLDIARKCIFECMKTGKPAFCGKDHVCYCGHRYSNMDNDTAHHPKQTYAMFKDMYKKYFGTDVD